MGTAGGLKVTDGGATVTAGGVKAAGGMTLDNSGFTVTAGGVRAAGGMTLDDEGLVITTGGATVTAGGLKVTDGGATVTAGGVKAAGGLTLDNSGFTVTAGGMRAAGGMTIDDDGIVVTSGGVTTTAVTSTAAFDVNAAASNAISFSIGGTEKARVHSDGNFGIGTATPGVKLDVNGGVQGTSAYSASSDLRWKKKITKLTHSLNKIMNISGVSYEFRREEYPSKTFEPGLHFGFIAQHLEPTIPEVVRTDSQGWKSVQYSAIVPVLVEAMKEQQRKIEEQDSQIQALAAQLQQQAKEVTKLRGLVQSQYQSQAQQQQLNVLTEAVSRLQKRLLYL